MRNSARVLVKSLAHVAFAIWFGGFTFYAAVVVPDLHANLGGIETGEVSRRVVVILYGIGLGALGLCWLSLAIDPANRSGWRGKACCGLMAVTSILLVAQLALHRVIGAGLDSGGSFREFHSTHEFYLSLAAVQWLANLGLIAAGRFSVKTDGGLGN